MRSLYDRDHAERYEDAAVARIAGGQHGLISRMQALGCGVTPAKIRWRLTTGRWSRVLMNVYRVEGAPSSWRQRAAAACLYLGPEAVLSFGAAATLTRMADLRSRPLEVTVPKRRNRSGKHNIVIHVPQHGIPAEDITTIDGIRVTKPARTLLDLATVEPEAVIERYLDDALRRRLVSLPFLEHWLADPRRARHRGARVLRTFVTTRATTGVTESPLEMTLLQLIRARRLPLPMLQYVVEDGKRFVARLDFAYPECKVAIEADGFRHHDTRTTFDDERGRGNDLEALGWRILRITAAHIERDPDAVVTWIARALAAR